MSMNAPMCITTTVPLAGASLNKTYTLPKGFSGNPATANGKCIVAYPVAVVINSAL